MSGSSKETRWRTSRFASDRVAHRPEGRTHLGAEQLRLFPGCEVPALVELVVMDEFGIRPLCPAPRGRIDFVGEGTHGDRDRDTPDVEEASSRRNLRGVPVKAR